MKKNMFRATLLASAAALVLASCAQDGTEQTQTEEGVTAPQETTGMKIAYVELDSLMSQYQLYKDYTDVLTIKGNNIQQTLAQKEQALQNHAAALQKKYESNGFQTRDELERAQASITREQQQLQELSERLTTEFATEQERINQEARDSIQAFLASYNKTKKYDYVMVKAGDNLLIANPQYDITSEVVKGLNKRYKPSADVKEKLDKKNEKKDTATE